MSFTEERKTHYSDCATHNEPAFPNGECDCDKMDRGAARAKTELKQLIKDELVKEARLSNDEYYRSTLFRAINLIEGL